MSFNSVIPVLVIDPIIQICKDRTEEYKGRQGGGNLIWIKKKNQEEKTERKENI